MKCRNCGYENPSEKKFCVKCDAPLTPSPEGRERETLKEESLSGGIPPRKTVRELSSSDSKIVSSVECPKCHYPVRAGSKFCPKCGTPLSSKKTMDDEEQEDEKVYQPVGKKFRDTVLPSRHVKCTFTMLAEPGELLKESAPISFSGDAILNRANTEPDNQTITSKEQAAITYENKRWYIQDKSELHTTYVCAGEKIEIKDGDIIVLGDRRFKFNS